MNLKKIHFGVPPVIEVYLSQHLPISSQLSFLLSFQTTMNPTRSVGQANFSKSSHNIASNGSFIVHKLASRSITENGLQIHVHKHVGFKLHLVWHVFDKHNTSVKCFERIFPDFNDLYDFCKQLKNGAFEGLCDCVCSRFFEWMDKINSYFRSFYTRPT